MMPKKIGWRDPIVAMKPTPEQIEAAAQAMFLMGKGKIFENKRELLALAKAALTAAAEVGRDDDVVVEGTKEGLDLFRMIERNHTIERCAQVADTFPAGMDRIKAKIAKDIAAAIRTLKDKP